MSSGTGQQGDLWRVLRLTKRDVDRRTFLKMLGALGFTVSSGGLLEACVSASPTPAPAAPKAAPPAAAPKAAPTPATKAARKGGTLVAGWDVDAGALDPGADTSSQTNQILNNIFERLLAQDLDSRAGVPPIKPELATSWKLSADGKVFTAELRKGVKFHDGTPFNAEAAKFNLDRATRKDFQYYSQRAGAVTSLGYSNIVDTEVIDEYSIRINFKKFDPNFEEYVGVRINAAMVSPDSVKKWGNAAMADHPVGTGPYKFVEREKNVKIVLEKNPDHWKGEPHLDRIIFRPIPDPVARVLALETGEVDFISSVPADSVAKLSANPNFTVATAAVPILIQVHLNHQAKPWSDRRVRQAANFAINREVLTKTILQDTLLPATSMLVPGSIGYDPNFKYYSYDPEKARALLREAGYPDGFETVIQAGSTLQWVGNPKPMFEFVQQNLAAVGILVKFELFDATTFLNMFPKGMGPEVGGMVWPATTSPSAFLERNYGKSFAPPKGRNLGAYDNPQVEALFKKAADTIDEAQRVKLYQQADRIAVEDGATLYLVCPRFPRAFHNKVKGFVAPNSGQFWLASVSLNQ